MKLTFWQVFMSTLAAFFGVQQKKVLGRDFKSQSVLPFIFMGLFIGLLLILLLLLIVSQVLS